MAGDNVIEFTQRMDERMAERDAYDKQMQLRRAMFPVIAEAIQQMRNLGATSQLIARMLAFSAEELRGSDDPEPLEPR